MLSCMVFILILYRLCSSWTKITNRSSFESNKDFSILQQVKNASKFLFRLKFGSSMCGFLVTVLKVLSVISADFWKTNPGEP